MLWFMGSQRVGHDWVNELNWMNIMILNLGNLKVMNQNPKINFSFLLILKKNPLYCRFWRNEDKLFCVMSTSQHTPIWGLSILFLWFYQYGLILSKSRIVSWFLFLSLAEANLFIKLSLKFYCEILPISNKVKYNKTINIFYVYLQFQ